MGRERSHPECRLHEARATPEQTRVEIAHSVGAGAESRVRRKMAKAMITVRGGENCGEREVVKSHVLEMRWRGGFLDTNDGPQAGDI